MFEEERENFRPLFLERREIVEVAGLNAEVKRKKGVG